VPWSAFWDGNYFGSAWPVLHTVMTNNYVRGAVTGLGVVNLCAGFVELAVLLPIRGRHDVP